MQNNLRISFTNGITKHTHTVLVSLSLGQECYVHKPLLSNPFCHWFHRACYHLADVDVCGLCGLPTGQRAKSSSIALLLHETVMEWICLPCASWTAYMRHSILTISLVCVPRESEAAILDLNNVLHLITVIPGRRREQWLRPVEMRRYTRMSLHYGRRTEANNSRWNHWRNFTCSLNFNNWGIKNV